MEPCGLWPGSQGIGSVTTTTRMRLSSSAVPMARDLEALPDWPSGTQGGSRGPQREVRSKFQTAQLTGCCPRVSVAECQHSAPQPAHSWGLPPSRPGSCVFPPDTPEVLVWDGFHFHCQLSYSSHVSSLKLVISVPGREENTKHSLSGRWFWDRPRVG